MYIVNETKPIKIWATGLEDEALEQARAIANLPFVFRHVALMPDSHMGHGMPIGGVAALRGVISPTMVGVDIGCGMCAVNTNIPVGNVSVENLEAIVAGIKAAVPVGFAKHAKPKVVDVEAFLPIGGVVDHELKNAAHQLGTLGGGNHFIEVQTDGKTLWVMIHSGSRNVGKRVADFYEKKAVEQMRQWHSEVPESLPFLPVNTDLGKDYIAEMNWCVEYALLNRKTMMDAILGVVRDVCGDFVADEMINIAHNYASLEHHFGENVWVHRKGATLAADGTIGIIPGSMGTKSYIVRGKGNPESFNSCSHGAGRKMSRRKARENLDLSAEQAKMSGIVHGLAGTENLDEAPGAYKDIDVVMENQADLVDIVVELSPLASVKG